MNGIEELPGIDPSKAHVARMYDYYLGGDNNFESDRIACMELDKLVPGTRGLAINNRNYLVRVVRTLARDYGVRQFLDIGTGTCASYCVPFKRLCEHGGAFAAGLFGFGREGYGPAAGGAAAGGQVPGFDPCVHGGSRVTCCSKAGQSPTCRRWRKSAGTAPSPTMSPW